MIEHNSEKTVAGVAATVRNVHEWLAGYSIASEYTIDTYPIGRTLKGSCKLTVEDGGKRGFRTVKQTTNKFGRWCAPKKSVYQEDGLIVVAVPKQEGLAGWLRLCLRSISFQHANGEYGYIWRAPFWCKPRREPRTYILSTMKEGQHVEPADPPELCDAWDAWVVELGQLIITVRGLQRAVAATWDEVVA